MRCRGWMLAAAVAALLGHAAKADETHLIMTTISSPTSQVGQQNFHGWADRVNEAGKGIVTVDVRDGFALANSTNFYDRLVSDVIQISFGSLNYIAGKFQLSQVMALPFVMDSAEQESVVFSRFSPKRPARCGIRSDRALFLCFSKSPCIWRKRRRHRWRI